MSFVFMPMVNVRPVHMFVHPRVVAMSMAVLANHRTIVMMIMVSIVVAMSVLVGERLVLVAVRVLLRQMEVNGEAE